MGGEKKVKKIFARSARKIVSPTFKTVAPPLHSRQSSITRPERCAHPPIAVIRESGLTIIILELELEVVITCTEAYGRRLLPLCPHLYEEH